MEIITHTVERKELKPGDHIYTWRKFKSHAHHGIYKGNDIVIHFRGKQRKEESRTSPDCKECYDCRKMEMDDPEKTGNNCPQEPVKKIVNATETVANVISGTGKAAAEVISGAGKAGAKAYNILRSNYKGKGPM